MPQNQPIDTALLLQEALDCANGNNLERAQTLALISLALSSASHEHSHAASGSLAEDVAIAADAFFTKPENTNFDALQIALARWRSERHAHNA